MTHKRHHEHFEESMENDEQLPVVEEETPEQKQEEANAELEALKVEAAKFKDLYVRAEAEMENLRRRTQKELENRSKFAVSSFAKDLLSVGDNLTRAMAALPESERENEQIKNLMVGLDLTQKDLTQALEKNGVTAIESIGLVFDPNKHKVVQEIDDPTKPTGTIVQEWQKGYMIGGDRVLREAVVVVTKGGPRADAPAEHVDTVA